MLSGILPPVPQVQQLLGSDTMPDLMVTLILGAFVFAAGGYLFTFKHVQAATKGLWAEIKDIRGELRQEIKQTQAEVNRVQMEINRVVSNDLRHIEARLDRLEDRH